MWILDWFRYISAGIFSLAHTLCLTGFPHLRSLSLVRFLPCVLSSTHIHTPLPLPTHLRALARSRSFPFLLSVAAKNKTTPISPRWTNAQPKLCEKLRRKRGNKHVYTWNMYGKMIGWNDTRNDTRLSIIRVSVEKDATPSTNICRHTFKFFCMYVNIHSCIWFIYTERELDVSDACKDILYICGSQSPATRIICVYICIHDCVNIYKYTYSYVHICILTCIYIHIYTYLHVYIHTYIHTCIHTYIHTYTHTYIYKHTYMLNG